MKLFTKILIGVLLLGTVLNIALIGQTKKEAKYTVSNALLTMLFNSIIIYGLLFWS